MARKWFILISMFILLLGAAGCSTGSSSQNETSSSEDQEQNDPIKLKVALYFATTSQLYKFVTEPWMEKVKELTDGKVEFEVYPSEQLGKAQDLLNLTKDGVADIGVFPVNYFPDNMPLSNLLAGLPNLSETAEQGTKAYYELIHSNDAVMETDFEKNGIKPILTHVSPTYEVWTTKKELRVPADLKGLKIRTPGGVANHVFDQLGVVPVTVTHQETYEALEKGVIDALSSSAIAADSNGTIELLKYVVTPHIGTAINTININAKVWESLPEDIQNAMIEAAEEILVPGGKAYDDDTVRVLDEFTAAGGKIVELTEEEAKQWEDFNAQFTEKWLKEHSSDGLPYEEVVNHYKELLEKHK